MPVDMRISAYIKHRLCPLTPSPGTVRGSIYRALAPAWSNGGIFNLNFVHTAKIPSVRQSYHFNGVTLGSSSPCKHLKCILLCKYFSRGKAGEEMVRLCLKEKPVFIIFTLKQKLNIYVIMMKFLCHNMSLPSCPSQSWFVFVFQSFWLVLCFFFVLNVCIESKTTHADTTILNCNHPSYTFVIHKHLLPESQTFTPSQQRPVLRLNIFICVSQKSNWAGVERLLLYCSSCHVQWPSCLLPTRLSPARPPLSHPLQIYSVWSFVFQLHPCPC